VFWEGAAAPTSVPKHQRHAEGVYLRALSMDWWTQADIGDLLLAGQTVAQVASFVWLRSRILRGLIIVE